MRPAEPSSAGSSLLGGRTPAAFLAGYWQKRPLLVRGALPHFHDPLTPDELAGLACEAEVESRLVFARGGTRAFQVVPGPQDARRLRRLPPSHWTLLVQGVDRHLDAVAALRDRFRFVPDWRIDDVMVSFAPRFGTVGPHLDSYDVFLVQGRGRRRWQIQTHPDAALRPGLDLRVLRRFRVEKEWVLEPGDLLYLPPGVAHYGVALEDCLTYSVGFRAPSHAELVAGALRAVLREGSSARTYRDPDLRPPQFPGEIAASALTRMRRIVRRELRALRDAALDRMVGELLTEPRDGAQPAARRLALRDLRSRLKTGRVLVRSPTSRLAFVRRRGGVELFVDGRCIPLPPALGFAAPLLTSASTLAGPSLIRRLGTPGFVALLADLVSAGVFAVESGGERLEPRPGLAGNRRGMGFR
jgi:50S ribosomal protein L16 3-hydroxylase